MSSKAPDLMEIEEVALCAAMRRRLNELTGTAAALADPRRWIDERPLASCLVVAGAGMAVGLLAGGRKSAATESPPTNGNHTAASHKEHQTIGAMLAASLVPTLQPMIRNLIHTALSGHAAGSDKTVDVAEEAVPSGLAEDNKVVG